jgi:hypothetical protein
MKLYVLPASHLKVHAAFEPGLAGEQSVFAVLVFLLAASILLLAVSYFLQLHGRSDEHSMAC